MSAPTITMTAPGKLFIIGEYAVLEGAPAILRVMPRVARVMTTPADKGKLTLISATVETLPLRYKAGSNETTGARLLDCVLETLLARQQLSTECSQLLAAGKLSLSLDTADFYRDGRKLGLGSSAALTVALTRALTKGDSPAELIQLATASHRRFQGGAGSGADIALSAAGRDIIFRQDEEPVEVVIPHDLHMLYIWTGTPADTTRFIGQFQTWREENPAMFDRIITALSGTAELASRALIDQSATALMSAIKTCNEQLQWLSQASRLGFYNQIHHSLQKQVESAGCIYKPSGAGGGDFGIAFSIDEDQLRRLATTLTGEGLFTCLATGALNRCSPQGRPR